MKKNEAARPDLSFESLARTRLRRSVITSAKSIAPSEVFRLAITGLAAIACLTVIHRTIVAALLARWLISRERSRAN
jgi:hypothetical protein